MTKAHLFITDRETGKDRYVEEGDLATLTAKALKLVEDGADAWVRPEPPSTPSPGALPTPNQSPAPDWADRAAQELHPAYPTDQWDRPRHLAAETERKRIAKVIRRHAPPPASAPPSGPQVNAQQGETRKHNPKHPIGTCGKCGAEMVYNVPRLGPAGGYVHKENGSLDCPAPAASLTDEAQGDKLGIIMEAVRTGEASCAKIPGKIALPLEQTPPEWAMKAAKRLNVYGCDDLHVARVIASYAPAPHPSPTVDNEGKMREVLADLLACLSKVEGVKLLPENRVGLTFQMGGYDGLVAARERARTALAPSTDKEEGKP